MKGKIIETEQIFSLLRRVSEADNMPISRHIALATRGKDIYHLKDGQLLELLEKYELEINFEDTLETPEYVSDVEHIIEEALDIDKLKTSIFEQDEE